MALVATKCVVRGDRRPVKKLIGFKTRRRPHLKHKQGPDTVIVEEFEGS